MTDSELDGRQIFVREDNGGRPAAAAAAAVAARAPGRTTARRAAAVARPRRRRRRPRREGEPPKSAADLDADMDSYFAKRAAAEERRNSARRARLTPRTVCTSTPVSGHLYQLCQCIVAAPPPCSDAL